MFTLLMLAIQVTAVPVANAQGDIPTVNGLFYGDGDVNRYDLLGEADSGRGSLYYKRVGNTLYLAVVVSSSVNDNVFGWSKKNDPDRGYVKSAGWTKEHSADKLIKSDHVKLNLQCGVYTYTWQHGYVYDADGDADPHEADWLSGYQDDSGGGGTPPPWLISSASSLQWNLNNAVTYSNTTWAWDVTLGGNRIEYDKRGKHKAGKWKSPDDVEWPPSDNDVTDEGWPQWDSTHQWEWAMVYEMSIDISACGNTPITVSVPSAHNSPSKDEEEDVPICTSGCTVNLDYGDAPTGYLPELGKTYFYPTLLADNGARHVIVPGVYLGSSVDPDAEVDGQPHGDALGDDSAGLERV